MLIPHGVFPEHNIRKRNDNNNHCVFLPPFKTWADTGIGMAHPGRVDHRRSGVERTTRACPIRRKLLHRTVTKKRRFIHVSLAGQVRGADVSLARALDGRNLDAPSY
ncbi:hypothetical protein [Paraburkholderia terrae]|uniref:hypothetical protein n=1 Tax=Paraburkholderia terrae TaxID=311230 RepID=UPI0012E01DCE|nr:hypothetical protein [Paraburkholderia terrae]